MSHPALERTSRALRLVTHNFVWKLIALAGATLIWVLVSSEPELSTFTTVRLAFRNLPADIDISSSPMETVSLELRGPASELRGTGESRRPAESCGVQSRFLLTGNDKKKRRSTERRGPALEALSRVRTSNASGRTPGGAMGRRTCPNGDHRLPFQPA